MCHNPVHRQADAPLSSTPEGVRYGLDHMGLDHMDRMGLDRKPEVWLVLGSNNRVNSEDGHQARGIRPEAYNGEGVTRHNADSHITLAMVHVDERVRELRLTLQGDPASWRMALVHVGGYTINDHHETNARHWLRYT